MCIEISDYRHTCSKISQHARVWIRRLMWHFFSYTDQSSGGLAHLIVRKKKLKFKLTKYIVIFPFVDVVVERTPQFDILLVSESGCCQRRQVSFADMIRTDVKVYRIVNWMLIKHLSLFFFVLTQWEIDDFSLVILFITYFHLITNTCHWNERTNERIQMMMIMINSFRIIMNWRISCLIND